jgi:multicomponent Na+:H+ antiporter subunit F
VLLAALLACAVSARGRSAAHILVGLQVAGPLCAMAMLLIAEGTGREPFGDLAIALAVMSFAGSLLFVRFLERMR